MSTTRINDNDLASVALYDKVNAIADEIDEEKADNSDFNRLDNEAVKLTGNQTVDGIKNFTDEIFAPNQLDYSRITNCLIDIPQDINLELVEGSLTLKAGSKVYFADGSSQVITNDISRSTYNDVSFYVYVNGELRDMPVNKCFSSDTQPTNFGNYGIWYDTVNKILKYTSNAFASYIECSFPVCLCSGSNNIITSIDQVFNGFGYIGNTRFFLPKIKALIPNGLNADGSCKNIEWENTNVGLYTNIAAGTFYCTFGPENDNYRPYYEQETQPTTDGLWYNPKTNLLKRSTDGGKTWVIRKATLACIITKTLDGITSINSKTTFQAVDKNDLKQVELPTGSVIAYSGNTAPNGYLICNGATVSRTTYAYLFNAIGTIYGAGDGSTTFNLPQLSDGRFIRGESTAGSIYSAGLPNIAGGPIHISAYGPGNITSGAFMTTSTGSSHNDSGGTGVDISFDASKSNSIYGNSTTVMPQSLSMRYYIKY